MNLNKGKGKAKVDNSEREATDKRRDKIKEDIQDKETNTT
jgi:hypothetical protein